MTMISQNKDAYRQNGHKKHAGHMAGGGGHKGQNGGSSAMESHGPGGHKLRGSAQQLMEKYTSLGRDALREGDGVLAESFFQYADHYRRLVPPPSQRRVPAEGMARVVGETAGDMGMAGAPEPGAQDVTEGVGGRGGHESSEGMRHSDTHAGPGYTDAGQGSGRSMSGARRKTEGGRIGSGGRRTAPAQEAPSVTKDTHGPLSSSPGRTKDSTDISHDAARTPDGSVHAPDDALPLPPKGS